MNEIKCLAVRQPWAWAICAGLKGIENRTWTTKHRGRIAIVASANKTDLNAYTRAAKPNKLSTSTFTLGAVIGVADLVDVEPLGPHLETNRWAFGPYCWRLANGRKFPEPIPCSAKLNLYAADSELDARIQAQVDRASTPNPDEDGRAWLQATLSSDEVRQDAHLDSYFQLEDWM